MSQLEIAQQALQNSMETGNNPVEKFEHSSKSFEKGVNNLEGAIPNGEVSLGNLEGALPDTKDVNLNALDGALPKINEIPHTMTEIQPEYESLKKDDLQGELNKYNREVEKYSAGGEVHPVESQDLRKLNTEELSNMRTEFNQNKTDILKNWESQNNSSWPRYSEDFYSESGKLIRRQGDRYDAHHVQPLELGGKNSAENITPMHARDHYDKQGIHRYNSPYDNITTSMRG